MEKNYVKEKKAAAKEFEDKKIELKENLIAELEEKKKMIENEKLTMELTGGKNKICYFSSPLHYCLEKKLKKTVLVYTDSLTLKLPKCQLMWNKLVVF